MKEKRKSQKKNNRNVICFETEMDQKTIERVAEIVLKNQTQSKGIDCKNYFSTIARMNNYYQEF